MGKVSYAVTNFTAGEISPLLSARVDLAKYANGCTTLKNMVIHPQGPASNRPGTHYAGSTKTHTKKSILVPFQFSREQAYILEFGDYYVRFWKDYGQITSGSPPAAIEVTTPYSQTDLVDLKWTQNADILFLFHPDYEIRKLTRTSHTAWTLTEAEHLDGPWMPENSDIDWILEISDITGDVTIQSTKDLFTADHVGSFLRVRVNGRSEKSDIAADDTYSNYCLFHGEWYASLDIDQTVGWRGKVTIQQSFDECETWTNFFSLTAPITKDFFEPEANVYYRIGCIDGDFTDGQCTARIFQDECWGVVKITSVTNARNADGEVIIRLGAGTSGIDNPVLSSKWCQSAWSGAKGYPPVGVFYENRLWGGGSAYRPQSLCSSRTDNYYNWTPGAKDDAALDITLASNQVNGIQWMVPTQRLIVGTTDGEWSIGATSTQNAITPDDTKAVPHTAHGGNGLAVHISNRVLFFDRTGRSLRALSYSIESDSLAAFDLTRLSSHITDPAVVGMAYQQQPHSILWCVRSDGVLIGMTYLPEDEVVAWHRHVTDGTVESIAVIPGDNGQDDLWLIVNRTIGGATKRFIEYMKPFDFGDDKEDAFFVDSGLTYDGAPATTISGLNHLEGKTVSILADGAVQASKTVASGAITLDRASSVVHVGLPYSSELTPVRPDAGAADGSSQGKNKRIHEVTVRVIESLGFICGLTGSTLTRRIPFRVPEDEMDSSPPLFTGDVRVEYPAGYDTDAVLSITQDQPLPLTVAGLFYKMNVYDK